MKKLAIIVLITAFISAGIFLVYQKFLQPNTVVEASTVDVINSALFNCAENKTIQAVFFISVPILEPTQELIEP